MDILSIVKLLWRQRWVVAATSAVCVVLLVVVVMQSPPKYEAQGTVVLFNPPVPPDTILIIPGTEEAARYENPYVRLNDVSVVVDVLRRVMSSDQAADRLYEKGVLGDYEIAANIDFYRGPIVDVLVEGESDSEAVAGALVALEDLELTLAELQDAQGTDPIYHFTADVVVPPVNARRVITGTLRRLIAAGGASTLLVLGSAIVADTIADRRKKGRGTGEAPAGAGDATGPIALHPHGGPGATFPAGVVGRSQTAPSNGAGAAHRKQTGT